MSRLRWIAAFAGIALVLVGCPTLPEGPVEEPVVVVSPESVTDLEPEQVEPTDQTSVPDSETETDTEPAADTEPAPIQVSETVYNRAFEEVETVIADLNQIIYRGDFDAWTAHLTEHYREVYSDPEVLADISRQPAMAQSGIHLHTMEDYFEHVVVPSRARARLDDLVFYSDTLVEAVSIFRGEPLILYLLRKVDGEWRIDTF